MLERRSLRAPVTLGVVLIVLIVILAAVWISGGVVGAMSNRSSAPVFWVILATGGVLLSVVLAGVIAYLTLTVKAFRLNQRQSNFIDSVTHELKSPIASLKLYLQTMTQREIGEEQQRDFRRIMLDDVERLDSLINHLLDAARIDRNAKPADEEKIRLDELLRQCAQSTCLRYKVPPESVHISSPEVTVVSKLVQIEILFRNLIDNAIKYGGSPPSVEVVVKTMPNEQVTVTVADNGPGIPPHQRRKVFGRFVRLGNELERSTPGTGLGLYLVRNVAKSLGGSIRLRDRRESKEHGDASNGSTGSPAATTPAQTGTEFEVTLRGVVSSSAAASATEPDQLSPHT
tara:strand:- start:198856 stop:199887 length:1032 start_codon:yes stop_codon:yes gene_type:complete